MDRSIRRVKPQPLSCCRGIDHHTTRCHLFAQVDQLPQYPAQPSWQTPEPAGPVRFVPPPAGLKRESFVPVAFAVFVLVAIVLIVAGVVIHDATSRPAADAASVTKPSAAPGVPVPQGCGATR